ncbi:MAG: FAD-dependent oxidoreductase [Roseiflexaceae bacterium]
MNVLIIGGVAAGMSAAARLRRLDEQARIVVLERDGYVSFANCGLPYHIGGSIPNREQLLVVTPEHLRGTLNLDVRTRHEALMIDRERRRVTVLNRQTGQQYQETYDVLVLAQGAEPLRPPVPGVDLPQIMTLRTLDDMDRIVAAIDSGVRSAVVIGASYIGIEMVEALRQRGLRVDLVELQEQVMPLLDPEIAAALAEELSAHAVALHLGVAARTFAPEGGGLRVDLSDGSALCADLVVLAVGVRPASALACAAGLALGPRGGIAVDPQMRTSDPHIYAAGDMVEVTDTVTGEAAVIALAGPANRQGRIIADAICGRASAYRSTQGTAIVKLFGRCAATTGASEKALRRTGRDYHKVYLHPSSHAGYYPGAQPMQIKLLFAPEDGRLLGAQIAGGEGVDKRIDVLATALRAGMSVFDLEHLELAYAPPYGSAKDPVNMAGFVAANLLRGDVAFWYAEQIDTRGPALLVDVRDPQEYLQGHIAGATNIPLTHLRRHTAELAALDRPIWLYCAVGFRSYLAYRILRQCGATEVLTLAGGMRTFSATHGQRQPLAFGLH